MNEFIDFIERDYFQSVLFDIVDHSYERDIKSQIISQLSSEGSEMYTDLDNKDEKVALPKIITFFFRMQQSDILVNQLKLTQLVDDEETRK